MSSKPFLSCDTEGLEFENAKCILCNKKIKKPRRGKENDFKFVTADTLMTISDVVARYDLFPFTVCYENTENRRK